MIEILSRNPKLIQIPLNWASIWVRGTEFYYDNTTREHADIVIQNQHNSSCYLPNTVCGVVELKSKVANHEVPGQLYKAVTVLDRFGKSSGLWETTIGIAIAPRYTPSAISTLKDMGYYVLQWVGDQDCTRLQNID